MTDVTRFLKGASDRRPTETVFMSPDPDALSAAQVAEKARTGGTLADAPADAEEARREALDSAWRFVVSTIPTSQWEHLIGQHPPTEEHVKEARRMGQIQRFNPETFPRAAAAACLVRAENPDGETLPITPPKWDGNGGLTVDPVAAELVEQVWEVFPMGETTRLWTTVVGMNVSADASDRVKSFASGSATTSSGAR